MNTFIIGEAGANHNGNFKQAIALIDVAKSAGADAVKFQIHKAETLYSKNTPKFAGHSNLLEMMKEIEIPKKWLKNIKQYCDDIGIEFMATPFDESAVEDLVNLGVKRIKIAGFESTDPRFVKMVSCTNLPLIISAGIGSNLESIGNIVSWVKEEQSNPDITVLHCNNAYPTPNKDVNLNRVDIIKNKYPEIKVGLSDHTEGIIAPSLAVAKGAVCIEKHYTMSRLLPGPDHSFAVEPKELHEMIKLIRTAEDICRDTDSLLTESENKFSKGMRSVIAAKEIKRGEIFSVNNLTTKRPLLDNSLHSLHYYDILGKQSTRDYNADDFISPEEK